MTKGYLLDTNAVSRWGSQNAAVVAHVARVAKQAGKIWVSAITLGELEFGHQTTVSTDPSKREEFIRWIDDTFPPGSVVDVTRRTRTYYGDIRSELFRTFPPRNPKDNHPEKCFDKVTASELGIDENDLWIAALSLERNLTLVSNDRMKRICTAAGKPLAPEDWEKPI